MASSAQLIFASFIDNELLMLIAFVSMLVVASMDRSLNRIQKRLTYIFAFLCMVYAVLAFIEFGIGSNLLETNIPLRMTCATLRNILKPVPIVLVCGCLSSSVAKNKLFYAPILLNTVLYLVNLKTGICFAFTDANEMVKGSCYYVGVAIFLLYVIILAVLYQKNPLIHTFGQRAVSILILLLIPLAEISEIKSSRNVLATAVLLADIFEYEVLIVLRSNKLLKAKDESLAEQKSALIRSQKASVSDDMTGTLNRRAYDLRIEQESHRKEINPDFTLVMCDLNGLKNINDNYGHQAGDEMVIGAARCLQIALGKYGDIYRVGGDEFTALLNCSEEQLSEAFEKLDSLCVSWGNSLVDELSISKGWARIPQDENYKIDDLIAIADRNMYEAKRNYYKEHVDRDRRLPE